LISAADPETVAELGGAAIRRDRSDRVLAEVGRLAAEGTLNPQVTSVVAFQDAPEAIAAVESGHPLGKVVLRIS
jgi:NADPH2:quinone reductase